MKIREVMTPRVIRISPEESASVAARTMTHYNVGAMPVCGLDGKLCGMVTDRDIVTRCLAAGKQPGKTRVEDIMTHGVVSVRPDMEASQVAALMARRQIRRLPVVEDGQLCGMVTLGDLSQNEHTAPDAVDALAEITGNVGHMQ